MAKLHILTIILVSVMCFLKGLSMSRICEDDQFQCADNRDCIDHHRVCNSQMDCRDNSDENFCDFQSSPYQHRFLCEDRKSTIESFRLCDGFIDCSDGSDEDEHKQCKGSCKSKNCPPHSECISGMLEAKCVCFPGYEYNSKLNTCDDIDKCKTFGKAKNCPPHSECISGRLEAKCVCFPGYEFNSELNTCEDKDECKTFGICSQGCTNTNGSYECTCADKYKLQSDNTNCQVRYGEPLLLYSTKIAVKGMYLKSKHAYTVADNQTLAIGVTTDGQNIYWINNGEPASIVKAREDGSNQEIVLTSGLDSPEEIAVDWLTGNIYFSDNALEHIAVCSNDGHYCTPLANVDVHQPRGIALWPQMGLMYWTDWGKTPMIARASMDGGDAVALVKTDIHWPNGIALDVNNERLYWVDAKLMTIESTAVDGTGRRTILSDVPKHPYGISVFEDKLYWSDWITKSIYACDKFTGKDQQVIAKGARMYSVAVYHLADQPKVEHACKKRRCSHLCLLAAKNSSTCACPDGMSLAIDRTRCINTVKKQTLYVALRNNLFEMEHTTFGKHKVLQEHTLPMFIDKMAYNSVNRTILIADNIQKVIAEYDVAKKELRNLIRGTVGNVTGLAFDHLGQNVYWTDSERHVVEVYSMRMKQRAIVQFFTGIALPIGIGLLPEEGKMFIALRTPSNVYVVEKTLSGNGDYSHVFETITGMGPIQILADYDTRTLYWVDTDSGKIEYSMFDDILPNPLTSDAGWTDRVKQPASMALIDKSVLWTTLNSTFLYWTHKTNNGLVNKIQLDTLTLKTMGRIQLLSSRPQTEHDHPCVHKNGECSHVCVAMGKKSATCLCPSGMVFRDARNQTCFEAVDCEVRCKSGECLNVSRRCDGRKDCPDGSDEAFCDSKPKKTQVVCAFDEFKCHDSTQCVPNELRCNKKNDCQDGSDEKHCETFDDSKKCHNHQHACDNGRCVDLSVMCDGFDDCGDKSDETNCDKKTEHSKPKCGRIMFQCTSGTCIPKNWECDGNVDCTDGSDEHVKCALKDCPKGMHKCNLGQCIDERLVCDGHNDCGDNSDELKCVNGRKTDLCGDEFDTFGNPKMFQCPSEPTVCLDWKAKCNGTAECPRGEDEVDCHGCSVYEFRCKTTSECIAIEFHCDGEKDCRDGSDELSCDRHKESTMDKFVNTCDRGMFDCKDGTCIDDSKTCDGARDCENGQDESEICTTACAKGNFCEQKCHPTLNGAKCSCFEGFKLAVDNRKCVDINECLQVDNPCAQVCENFPGGYRCSCYSGFMLRPDKTSCKSLESEYSLLFATHNEIRSLTESPRALQVLWSVNDTTIANFDLDIARKKLYYTTHEGKALFEWSMDKGELTGGLAIENVSKVTVDWITGNVYLISQIDTYRLRACDFEKKLCADIIKLVPMEIMTELAVDAINRKIFYTAVTGSAPSTHICVAGLDGYRHTILVTTRADVTALEADTYKKELYFVDAHSHTLLSISYSMDSDRSIKTVIRNENAIIHPTAISVHENMAYIVNMGIQKAYYCRLYGDKTCEAFHWNVYAAKDIVVNSPSRQRIVANDCYHKKCSGLCVLGPDSAECICNDGSIHDEYFKCPPSMDMNTSPSSPIAAVLWTLAVVLIIAGITGYLYRRRVQKRQNFGSVSVQLK